MINVSFEKGCFPDEIKISPIFTKNDDLDKENYRPVSMFLISLKELCTCRLILS